MRANTIVSHSTQETERVAATFAKTLHGGEVVLLDGDLGAGKTVFVRGLAKALGVRGRITSPTFVLMRVHRTAKKQHRGVRSKTIHSQLSALNYFVHVDAYRVRDPRELEAVGLLEWVGRPNTVVVVEWGERVRELLDAQTMYRVSIAPDSPRTATTNRRISMRMSND